MTEKPEFSEHPGSCVDDNESALRKKIYGVIDFLDSPIASPQVQCKVLEGVVAFVDVRSDHDNRSEAIERQLQRLGATIAPKLSNEVTHVVFKDGRKVTREKAEKLKLHLVSVLWVDSCKQTQERVPESLFPISGAQGTNTPLCLPRLKIKKTKSMQPKDFDVDLANSAERADKRRKRRSMANKKNDVQTPSKLQIYVMETQDMSPIPKRYTPNITIPDTPPSMKDLVQRLRNRHLEPSEESDEKETQSPLVGSVTGPLQRRLFDKDNPAELSLSPGSPVIMSGGMPPPAVGESPTKATSASPGCSRSPGGAHVPRLHLEESSEDTLPGFNLVEHLVKAAESPAEDQERKKKTTPGTGRRKSSQGSAKQTKRSSSRTRTPTSEKGTNKNKLLDESIEEPSVLNKSSSKNTASHDRSAPRKQTPKSGKDEQPVRKVGRRSLAEPTQSDVTPKGDIKRRRSSRLSCVPVLPTQDEDNTSNNNSIKMADKNNNAPNKDPIKGRTRRSYEKPGLSPVREQGDEKHNKSSNSKKGRLMQGKVSSVKSQPPSTAIKTLTKKGRQSIDEFSTRSFNVSLNRKIHSQSLTQKLSEPGSSPGLNIRKRNSSLREKSMSGIASQLESTALGASRLKADDTSSSRSTSVCEGKPSSLVMTSLHYDQQDVVKSVVKKLGQFKVRDTVSASTTHLVCGRNRRTLNVLHSIAQGCWILSYEWVLKSLEAGQWLEESPYEVDYFPAAKKSRLMQKKPGKNCSIFGKCGSVFVGENTVPPKSHIVKLLKKCSAQITSDSEDADIVVGNNCPSHSRSVNEQWVLDSISSFQCADIDEYRIDRRSVARSESPQY